MNLLMISGDRSAVAGKKGAFHATLTELIKHFDSIHIICPRTEEETEGTSEIDGVEFHPAENGLLFQPAWILKKGRELHAKVGFGVMTAHDYPPFYNGFGAKLLVSQTNIPCVLEIHHIVGYPKAASFSEWIGKWMSRFCVAIDSLSSVAVRTVNNEVRDFVVSWGVPSSKVHVVPSFYLDPELLRPDLTLVKKYDVVFCGRLVPNKGLLNVIRAVGLLPDVTLFIIGEGPEKYPAKRLIRELGIEQRVVFGGWLGTPADVIAGIRSAKVMVMNSHSEGGPRVALEAMACGMPLVATRVGVMPDVITDGENGVFTTGEPQDLAEKLKKLLPDAELQKRLGHVAQRVIDKFDKRAAVERYADFLKEASKKK